MKEENQFYETYFSGSNSTVRYCVKDEDEDEDGDKKIRFCVWENDEENMFDTFKNFDSFEEAVRYAMDNYEQNSSLDDFDNRSEVMKFRDSKVIKDYDGFIVFYMKGDRWMRILDEPITSLKKAVEICLNYFYFDKVASI